MLGGSQGRSGRVRKISLPSGFDPRPVQPTASRYTDWAIPAPNISHCAHWAIPAPLFGLILYIYCRFLRMFLHPDLVGGMSLVGKGVWSVSCSVLKASCIIADGPRELRHALCSLHGHWDPEFEFVWQHTCVAVTCTWGAGKSLARPARKQANVMSEWREFPSAPCLAKKKKFMTARVCMLLRSRKSLDMLPSLFLT